MFLVHHDKKNHGNMYVVPMGNEEISEMFVKSVSSQTWVYYCDGKPHGRFPTVVIPSCVDIWGGADMLKRAGYTKHWAVFEDIDTGLFYFGNYPSFSKSPDPDDRKIAARMMPIDISLLQKL